MPPGGHCSWDWQWQDTSPLPAEPRSELEGRGGLWPEPCPSWISTERERADQSKCEASLAGPPGSDDAKFTCVGLISSLSLTAKQKHPWNHERKQSSPASKRYFSCHFGAQSPKTRPADPEMSHFMPRRQQCPSLSNFIMSFCLNVCFKRVDKDKNFHSTGPFRGTRAEGPARNFPRAAPPTWFSAKGRWRSRCDLNEARAFTTNTEARCFAATRPYGDAFWDSSEILEQLRSFSSFQGENMKHTIQKSQMPAWLYTESDVSCLRATVLGSRAGCPQAYAAYWLLWIKVTSEMCKRDTLTLLSVPREAGLESLVWKVPPCTWRWKDALFTRDRGLRRRSLNTPQTRPLFRLVTNQEPKTELLCPVSSSQMRCFLNCLNYYFFFICSSVLCQLYYQPSHKGPWGWRGRRPLPQNCFSLRKARGRHAVRETTAPHSGQGRAADSRTWRLKLRATKTLERKVSLNLEEIFLRTLFPGSFPQALNVSWKILMTL